jgi:KDO2-lipid IV(A) lauroyltransferase
VGILPSFFLNLLSHTLARLVFSIFRIRRRVVFRNLKSAFPNKPSNWYKQIAYQSYWHFVMVLLEYLNMNKLELSDLERMIVFDGNKELKEAYQQNKRIILLSAHFGNWEFLMGFIFRFGFKTVVIQQRQKNIFVNEQMKKLREKWGMEVVYPRGAVDRCVTALKNGKNVGILSDQDAGKRGVFIPFFGHLASTHQGVAIIHLKTKVPVFFITCTRTGNNRFLIKSNKLTELTDDESINKKIYSLLSEYMNNLEKVVEQHPEQYFWMHKRWKTSPIQR